jgi:uncharacterized RDD family membrane protein YckC
MNAPNPYAPPQAAVRDIEDADPGAARADRGTRLAAAILDGMIFSAMVYVPLFVSGAVTGIFAAAARARGIHTAVGASALGVGGLIALAGLIAWIWLTVLFVSRNGQSIAKKLLGIKVLRKDGSPASLGRIFWLRNVVNTVLAIIPLYALIDVLMIFGDTRQCLHDRIADTVVVKA